MTGKVALIAPRFAPAIGGVERVVEMQARELRRRGVSVDVITTDPTGRLARRESRDGVGVYRFPTVANDSIYFLSPWLGAWLERHAHEYSVLHAHSYHTPLAFQAALAGRRSKVPVVVNTHYHGTGHTRVRRLLHTPYRPIGAWTLRHVRWVVCVSAVEQALIARHFGSRVRTLVAPNAIDPEELSPARRGHRDGSLHVLSVGRLDAYKQPERPVMAMQYLTEARLTAVGDGPAASEMIHVARDLGVTERVNRVGHVKRDELLDWYARADVFVSLSRHESFGLAVLEAAVAGLPVVASDIPAHREVAAYTAPGRVSLIDPDCSPRELAAMLVEAAANGRATDCDVASWPLPTWSRHVDLLLQCYQIAAEVPA